VRRGHLDGGVAIRQGLDDDVMDDVIISMIPVVISTGRRLFGRPQIDLDARLGSQLSQRARTGAQRSQL